MSLSVIALIIVGIMCVLYIWGKLPVALVTALGMLAMIFTGCVSSSVAFSNFGSTPVLLVFGMVIIVDAILESGLLTQYEHLLEKMTRRSEKGFLVLTFLSAGIISMFTNNTALVAMFMPFITSVAKSSGGRIRRKHIYLPLAMGGLIGGTGSLAGSTAPLLANEVLEITGQPTFSFFTTAPVCLAILAVVAVCYWFFLYDLTVKWFDFEEADGHERANAEIQLNRKNAIVSGYRFPDLRVPVYHPPLWLEPRADFGDGGRRDHYLWLRGCEKGTAQHDVAGHYHPRLCPGGGGRICEVRCR